jgi:hypothetical protein
MISSPLGLRGRMHAISRFVAASDRFGHHAADRGDGAVASGLASDCPGERMRDEEREASGTTERGIE